MRILRYEDMRILRYEDIWGHLLVHQDSLAGLHGGQRPDTGVDVDEPLTQVLHPDFLYPSLQDFF